MTNLLLIISLVFLFLSLCVISSLVNELEKFRKFSVSQFETIVDILSTNDKLREVDHDMITKLYGRLMHDEDVIDALFLNQCDINTYLYDHVESLSQCVIEPYYETRRDLK